MQQITTTFDRVFDVVASGTPYRQRGTLFSFESSGLKEYGVLIAGNPTLRSGMTVTAILKVPGNWQSLMCWQNHQTGEIVFGGHEPPPLRILHVIPLGVVAATVLHTIFRQSPWLAICGAAVVLAYLAGEVFTTRQLLHARAQLRQAGTSADAPDRPVDT